MNAVLTVRTLTLTLAVAFLTACCADRAVAQDDELEAVANRLNEKPTSFQKAYLIRFEGPIDYKRTKYFESRVARAKRAGADLVIVEIDSPGGLKTQSLQIADTLRDIDWAYTVAYIPREAISGAALMSLGCDEIIMSANARIGDVGAIQFDPEFFVFRAVPAKAQSVLVRRAQDLAISKGRSKELAESMIDQQVIVFRSIDNPEGQPPQFKTVRLESEDQNPVEAARKSQIDLNKWQLVEESGPGRFLTVNGQTAVDLGLANSTVESRKDLTTGLNVNGSLTVCKYSTTDSVVYWLNTPIFTIVLVVVGFVALYVELSAPGIGMGGLLAGLCAILFFWSRFLGGTSGVLEIILFSAGVIFILMEIFVIPGWGLAGFSGLLLVFVSAVMASQEFVIPATTDQWRQTTTSVLVFLCSGVIVIIAAGILTRHLGKIPILGNLMLQPPTDQVAGTDKKTSDKPVPNEHPLVSVGDWGVAESLLRPAGRARFGEHSVDVVSDGAFVESEAQIRVVEISGNRIVVSEVGSDDETVWQGDLKDS